MIKEWRGVSLHSTVHVLPQRPLVGLPYRVLARRGLELLRVSTAVLLTAFQIKVLGAAFLRQPAKLRCQAQPFHTGTLV